MRTSGCPIRKNHWVSASALVRVNPAYNTPAKAYISAKNGRFPAK